MIDCRHPDADGQDAAAAERPLAPRTAAALAAADTTSAQLLERVTDGCLALDADWRVVYLNSRAAQALGRRREDLLGKDLWAELPEGVGGPFHRAYTHAMSTQLPAHFEAYAPTRERWFANHLYPSPEGLTIFFTDITEVKGTEQALRETNEWLRLALRGGGFASGNADLTTRQFLHVSDTYKAHYGLAHDAEFSLDTLVQIIHPEDRPRVRSAFQRAVEGGPDYQIQYRVIWPDGDVRWLSAHGSLIHDATGRAVNMIGVVQDITENRRGEDDRRQAELAQGRALQRAEQLLQVGTALGGALTTSQVADVILQAALPIFQASMGLIVLLSEDGTALRILQTVGAPTALSDPWREFSLDASVPLAEAVRERRLVLRLTNAQFNATYPGLIELHRSTVGMQVAVPLMIAERCIGGLGLICPPEHCQDEGQQTFLWTLAGQCALALERARLYDEAEQAREAALCEVAERRLAEEALRESEQRLWLALASGRLGTWHFDVPTYEFINISNQCKAHYGLPPEARPTAMELLQAAHPDDRDFLQQTVRGSIRDGRDYSVESRVVWPDGSVHWISTHGTPMSDEAGKVVGLIGVTQEITERKEQEAQREQVLQEAQERADRDPLTGLLNHRAFYVRLEAETQRASRDGTSVAVAVLDLDNFKFFNDVYGHPVGDEVLRQVADRLKAVCRPYDVVARFGGDEFALLLGGIGQTTGREIETRLRAQVEDLSFLPEGHDTPIPLTLSVGVALFPDHASERLAVVKLADERLMRAKTGGALDGEAESIRAEMLSTVEGFSILDALVAAVDNKDRYTRRHSEDVMTYCLMIARELGLDESERPTVAMAALLHDVGSIGVPDAVLRKPGPLTAEEFEAVKQHPHIGAIIISAVPGLEATLDAVRHHHERWDGGGYPARLIGDETPLVARLMAVADAFSAMTTDRPYRTGMDREKALSVLAAGTGTQWDPDCVEAFFRALETPLNTRPAA